MNSDNVFLCLFAICFLAVIFGIGYSVHEAYEFEKYAIDNGYEQVLVPCKTIPIWKKVDSNKCLEKTNGT